MNTLEMILAGIIHKRNDWQIVKRGDRYYFEWDDGFQASDTLDGIIDKWNAKAEKEAPHLTIKREAKEARP